MKKFDCQQKSYFDENSIGVWRDSVYYAAAFQDGEAIRLDVVRHDLKDGLTWDDLRYVKNACGYADMDAVEFYPKESDVINTGNVRHLYIFNTALPLIRRSNDGK